MGTLRNALAFFAIYLVILIPTYILPYFGSNSSVLGAAGAISGIGLLPQFWMHAGCLLSLVLLTWLRGSLANKAWITTFPALAAVADLAPGFSLIPLLPSLLHTIALVLGARAQPALSAADTAPDQADATAKRRARIATGVLATYVVIAVLASNFFVRTTNAEIAGLRSQLPVPATQSLHVQPPQAAAPAPAPDMALFHKPQQVPYPPIDGYVTSYKIVSSQYLPDMNMTRVSLEVEYDLRGPKNSSAALTAWTAKQGLVFGQVYGGAAVVFAGKGKETVFLWLKPSTGMPPVDTDELLFGYYPAADGASMDETKAVKVFNQRFRWKVGSGTVQ